MGRGKSEVRFVNVKKPELIEIQVRLREAFYWKSGWGERGGTVEKVFKNWKKRCWEITGGRQGQGVRERMAWMARLGDERSTKE